MPAQLALRDADLRTLPHPTLLADAMQLRRLPDAVLWHFGDHAIVYAPSPQPRLWAPCTTSLEEGLAALSHVRPTLGNDLHAFTGAGVAGVLSKTHHLTMVGPFQRFTCTTVTGDPHRLVPISAAEGRALTHLRSRDIGPWGGRPGVGVRVGNQIVAALELLIDDPESTVVRLGPVRMARVEQSDDIASQLLRDAASHFAGRLLIHDVRMDHRRRVGWAQEAALLPSHAYEHWHAGPKRATPQASGLAADHRHLG